MIIGNYYYVKSLFQKKEKINGEKTKNKGKLPNS